MSSIIVNPRVQAAYLYEKLVGELRAANVAPAVLRNALAMLVGAEMAAQNRTDREAMRWSSEFAELLREYYEKAKVISARHRSEDEIVKIDFGTFG